MKQVKIASKFLVDNDTDEEVFIEQYDEQLLSDHDDDGDARYVGCGVGEDEEDYTEHGDIKINDGMNAIYISSDDAGADVDVNINTDVNKDKSKNINEKTCGANSDADADADAGAGTGVGANCDKIDALSFSKPDLSLLNLNLKPCQGNHESDDEDGVHEKRVTDKDKNANDNAMNNEEGRIESDKNNKSTKNGLLGTGSNRGNKKKFSFLFGSLNQDDDDAGDEGGDEREEKTPVNRLSTPKRGERFMKIKKEDRTTISAEEKKPWRNNVVDGMKKLPSFKSPKLSLTSPPGTSLDNPVGPFRRAILKFYGTSTNPDNVVLGYSSDRGCNAYETNYNTNEVEASEENRDLRFPLRRKKKRNSSLDNTRSTPLRSKSDHRTNSFRDLFPATAKMTKELVNQEGGQIGDDDSVCFDELESSQSSNNSSILLDLSFDRDDDSVDCELDEFWEVLPILPTNFTETTNHNNSLLWLDTELKKDYSWYQTRHLFAREHQLYSHALLQLLAERDQVGVEDSIHDESNIIKKGPLKKKTNKFWKVKYLELRKGNLVYYGDRLDSNRESGGTIIHLRQATSACTPTVANNMSVPGSGGGGAGGIPSVNVAMSPNLNTGSNTTALAPRFGLDLWVEGKRYCWLANSEDERQAWIRAFRQAMIGENIDDEQFCSSLSSPLENNDLDMYLAPYQDAILEFRNIQSKLFTAASRETYVSAIKPLLANEVQSSSSLQIPILWVRDQIKRTRTDTKKDDFLSPQRRLKTTIIEFWKSMSRNTFAINGHVVESSTPYAEERTLGALTRCILEYDKSFDTTEEKDNGREQIDHANKEKKTLISELQAVSYARRILMSIIRSKALDDVTFAAEYLCGRNKDLVRVEPVISNEPLLIDVSYAGDNFAATTMTSNNDISGWALIRKVNRTWHKRFCVLSAGVMSYYEKADPRPHGLRAQLVLGGAKIRSIEPGLVEDDNKLSKEDCTLYVLQLHTIDAERERQIAFTEKVEFYKWKVALQDAIDSCTTTIDPGFRNRNTADSSNACDTTPDIAPASNAPKSSKFLNRTKKKIKGKIDVGSKVRIGRDAAPKVRTGRLKVVSRILSVKNGIEERRRRRLQNVPSEKMLRNASSQALSAMGEEEIDDNGARVKCIVEASSAFRIVPSDVIDNDPGDAWMLMQVKVFQAYLLSGGPSGCLVKGDALIEIAFVDDFNAPTIL